MNGVSIYGASDSGGDDAYINEAGTMDMCGAHSDANSR